MIREWLESAVGDVIEASNGNELRINCPFCESRIGKPDVKHHMYVSTASPVAMCFRCTWQGNYISLIISVSGCSYAEALKQLESQSPTPNVARFEKLFSPCGMVTGPKISYKPDGFCALSAHDDLTKEALAVRNYLINRRMIPQAIVYKYMGWAPGTNRAWILIDSDFWQGRLIIPGDPKYISPPWPKGDALWNAGALEGRHAIICEGVLSAIAVGSNALALCGKTITQPQAKRIARSRVGSITIMLDADATRYSYDIAKALEENGYSGVLKIHELEQGDPTDGLEGRVVGYDLQSQVRSRIFAAV